MALITADKVGKVFKNLAEEIHAVRDFSLDIEAGDFYQHHGAVGVREDDIARYARVFEHGDVGDAERGRYGRLRNEGA